MRKSLRSLVILPLFLLLAPGAFGRGRERVEADVRPAYLFSSFRDDVMSEMLESVSEKVSHFGASLHLQYGFRADAASTQGRMFPEAWQGLGLGVNFLGHPQAIGLPVSLYLFQGAPVWHISERLALFYEWNFGISGGWRACDGRIARSNLIVGSRMNAYINLGTGLEYALSPDWSLKGGLEITHFSDGNTSFPNPGVNMAGVRVGLVRTFGREKGKRLSPAPACRDTVGRKRMSLDFTAYGAWRKRVYRGGETPVLLPGHFPVTGLDIAPMWSLSANFRAGVSADFQWDKSSGLKPYHLSGSTTEDIRFGHVPFFRQVSAGLSARAELMMPFFSVNVGLGYNPLGPSEARASYQLANLKIRVGDSFFINIGYQLQNFSKQNNLMLGAGYSLPL